jgi:hypothetical protein
VPETDAPGRLGNAINGSLGSGNIQKGALGIGDPRKKPGVQTAHRCVWASVKLAGNSGAEIEIIHTLKSKPVLVSLDEWEGGTGALTANASRKDRWTATTARVTVYTTGANLNGILARFRVWGE